jgi:hypothetical protein
MAIQSTSLTFEDLQRIRETCDERMELIEGELFVTPSPLLCTNLCQRVFSSSSCKQCDNSVTDWSSTLP